MSVPRPDLQELRDRLTITWNYLRPLMEQHPLSPLNGGAKRAAVSALDEVIVRVGAGESVRHLRELLATLTESATGLRPEQAKELEALLAERFGPTARLDNHDEARRDRVVKRGRIRTADEYRLISTRVEEIHVDRARREELETLNDLLVKAHARRRPLPER